MKDRPAPKAKDGKKPRGPKTLALRPAVRKDLPLLRDWKNDPSARRWIGDGTRTFSEEDMLRWFARTEESIDRDRRWVVEEENSPVGFVGLYKMDPVLRRAEAGILLGPDARGRATLLLLDEVFGVLNLNRVYLQVLADHQIARNMYKRCGFQEEGRLREHNFKAGKYVDVIAMGILAGEHAALGLESRRGGFER